MGASVWGGKTPTKDDNGSQACMRICACFRVGCSMRGKTFTSGLPVLHHVRFPLANVVCSLAVALPSVQQRRTQVAHICLQLACVGKPVTLTPPLPLFLPSNGMQCKGEDVKLR